MKIKKYISKIDGVEKFDILSLYLQAMFEMTSREENGLKTMDSWDYMIGELKKWKRKNI